MHCSTSKPKLLTTQLLQRKKLFWRVRKRCSICTIANRRMKALIHCGTLDFVRKLGRQQPFHSPKAFQRLWQLPHIRNTAQAWKLTAGKLLPVRTDLPPAHASLLEVIRCNRRTDCSTQRCTCRKHGLDCSPAGGECKGHSYANSTAPDLDADRMVTDG